MTNPPSIAMDDDCLAVGAALPGLARQAREDFLALLLAMRLFLEDRWAEAAATGEPDIGPAVGYCWPASRFAAMVLSRAGREDGIAMASWLQPVEAWHGWLLDTAGGDNPHAFLIGRADGNGGEVVIDLTADQFGHAAVTVAPFPADNRWAGKAAIPDDHPQGLREARNWLRQWLPLRHDYLAAARELLAVARAVEVGREEDDEAREDLVPCP